MTPCWNCKKSRPEDGRFCSTCGSLLNPPPQALPVLNESLQYLLREVRRWTWLDEDRRTDLLRDYREREARLKGLATAAPPPQGAAWTGAPMPHPPGGPPQHPQPAFHGAPPQDPHQAHPGGPPPHPQTVPPGSPQQGPAGGPPPHSQPAPSGGPPPYPQQASPGGPPAYPPAVMPAGPAHLSQRLQPLPPDAVPGDASVQDASPLPPVSPPGATQASPPSQGAQPPMPEPGPGGPLPAPAATPPTPGFLEEGNIRWFFTLGGLLLLAGGIGLLSSQWGRVGTFVVTLGLLLAPGACFGGAWWLRRSLPISSRLLSVLGGLLLPTGLLAVRRFGLLGVGISDVAWTAGVFLVSSAVLLCLCLVLAEAACLWLGTLSLCLALGALATWLSSGPWVFGLGALVAAFGWLALSRLPARGRFGEAHELLRPHFFPLSQVLATLGLLSTLPGWAQRSGDAPILFFMGAAFFAMAGLVSKRPGALYVAGLAGACFAGLGVWWASAPVVYAAYAFLAMGTAWLTVARLRADDPEIVAASYRMGTGMTGVALFFLFGVDLLRILVGGLAGLPAGHLAGSLGAALLASVFYCVSAVLWQRPGLVYGATVSLAYAGLIATVGFDRVDLSLVALYLAGFPLVVLGFLVFAERSLPAVFSRPMVDVALALSFIPGPLALALRVNDPGVRGMSALTVALLVAFYLLLLRFRRSPGWLYACMGWALVDLALLKTRVGHTGLSFVPIAALLALAGRALEQRHGREWAIPPVRTAWALAWGVLLLQPYLFLEGEPMVPVTLGLLAVGLAFFSTQFEGWTCLDRTAPEVLSHLAALVLPAVAYTALYRQVSVDTGLVGLLALLLIEVGMARMAQSLGNARWASALRLSALCWAVVTMALPHGTADPAARWALLAAPTVIWLAVALTSEGVLVGAGSVAVALASLVGLAEAGDFHPFAAPGAGFLALALLSAGYAGLAPRDERFVVPSWLLAMGAWRMSLVYLGLPEQWLAIQFWPFAALVAGAYLYWRLPVLEILAHVTAGIVLALAFEGSAGQVAATSGLWAVACGAAAFSARSTGHMVARFDPDYCYWEEGAVSARSTGYLVAATSLAPFALGAWGISLEASGSTAAIMLACLSLAWVVAGYLLDPSGRRNPLGGGVLHADPPAFKRGPPPAGVEPVPSESWREAFSRIFRIQAMILAVVVMVLPHGTAGPAMRWLLLVAPTVTWLAVALTSEGILVGSGSVALALASLYVEATAGAFNPWVAPGAGCAALALLSAGYGGLARRDERFVVPSWLLAMGAWRMGLAFLGLPEQWLALQFWPFAALVAGAFLYWRLPVLELLAQVTAGFVLALSFHGGAGQVAATSAVWAAACGAAAFSARSSRYLLGATSLAPLSLVALAVSQDASGATALVLLALLSLAWLVGAWLLDASGGRSAGAAEVFAAGSPGAAVGPGVLPGEPTEAPGAVAGPGVVPGAPGAVAGPGTSPVGAAGREGWAAPEDVAPVTTEPWRQAFSRILGVQSMVLAALVASVGLVVVYEHNASMSRATLAVLLAVAALAGQGWLSRQSAYYHLAYVTSHLLLIGWLPDNSAVEWFTLPLSAWLLLWSVVGPRSQRAMLETVATSLAIFPSVAASVVAPRGPHALWAGVLGLGAVLHGASSRRAVILVTGSLGLLLEALLQLHLALSGLGWQIYSFVAGVTLCSLGVFIERRRRDLDVLREKIKQQFSGIE